MFAFTHHITAQGGNLSGGVSLDGIAARIDLTPEPWTVEALCAQTDPELFFPEAGGGKASREARMTCLSCPVKAECLQYALDRNERWGVWGGMSERERRRLKRRRAA